MCTTFQVNYTAKTSSSGTGSAKCREVANNGQVAVVQPLTLNRIAQKMSSPQSHSTLPSGHHVGSGVMTTFVPKANGNMMMTSSTIVTSFDETDEAATEDSSTTKASTSRMSSDETSSLFYSMKTSL